MGSRKLFIIVMTVLLFIIWGHSMMSGSSSSEESGLITRTVQGIIDLFHIPLTVTDHIVRKIAHFIEYAVLGGVIGTYIYPKYLEKYSGEKSSPMKKLVFIMPMLAGFFTAFFDETIQIFSGRGAMIQDVWLDLAGAAAGSLIIFMITAKNFQGKRDGTGDKPRK